jgi:NAD(P)-dependent dehydrogenase (short-subunit alcohol dehydrogenase family)
MKRGGAPRRIVLTGATRGLGRALTARFAERGHEVQGCGRSAEGVARLSAAHPAPSGFAAVDVADAQAVDAWARRILASGPAPDLLLNNAAVVNRQAPLWEQSAEELDALLAVNVSGTVNVLRAFLPAMIARGSGVVLNVSSGWGRSSAPLVAPYCASKWAIEGLTQALAAELPPGLVAAAVNPGIIDTEMLRVCFGEEAGDYPGAEAWSHGAAEFLLAVGPRDHGRALTIPEPRG